MGKTDIAILFLLLQTLNFVLVRPYTLQYINNEILIFFIVCILLLGNTSQYNGNNNL